MRYWMYCEPVNAKSSEAVWQVWSDAAILADYWEYWCRLMRLAGRESQISENNCITDWAASHWANTATHENLQRIIQASEDT